MKTLSRVLLISAALAMLALPLAALAGERALPLTKKIQAGTTVVQYAGQSIRFVNPVPIVAKFNSTSETAFDLQVWGYATGPIGGGDAAAMMLLVIRWDDWGEDVYNGSVPPASAPWGGTFDTESGFTEK